MLKGELLDAAEVLTKSLAGLRDKLQSLKDEMGWSGEEWEEAVVWPETGGKVFQEMAGRSMLFCSMRLRLSRFCQHRVCHLPVRRLSS